MTRRSKKVSHKIARDSLAATTDVAVTVWHRLPILVMGVMQPTPERTAEASLMVSEKIEAVMEGSFAACTSMMAESHRAFFRAAQGRFDFDDLFESFAAIAFAASTPALKRVKANARRLSR